MAVRQALTLAALRAAFQFGTAKDMERAIGWWAGVKGGIYDDELAALCADLIDRQMAHAAASLAGAEVSRCERAHALYLLARCLDAAARIEEAISAFRRAAERALHEGDAVIASASQVQTVHLLLRDDGTSAEAVAEATKIDRTKLRASEALFIASVLLESPSRFVRASALATLTELARGPCPSLGRERALRLGAQHAEERGDTLSAVEAERLVALVPELEARRIRASELETTGEMSRVLVEAARRRAQHGDRETAISYLREARARFGPR